MELNADGSESSLETVHALLRSPLRIEYYRRDSASGQRVEWPESERTTALSAIETTIALATAKEVQQNDPSFVGAKA